MSKQQQQLAQTLSKAARNPFCVDHGGDDEWLRRQPKSWSASTDNRRSSISSPLGSLEPSSPSSTKDSSPRSSSHQRSVEDEILGSLAQSAMRQVKSMALNAFDSGAWKECKATASELMYEQRSSSAFRIIAKSLVPCTVDEFSSVLSSADSDQFNASMLEICGAQFAFGVTVRGVPTSVPESHLSIKAISFSSANPLSSAKRTINFLDYVEANAKQSAACRVVHTLARTQDFGGGRKSALSDVLVGYMLEEEPETRQSMIFFYATHFVRDAGDSLRSETLHRLRRMAQQVSAKCVAIATRRRLGSHKILEHRAPSTARHQICGVCVQAFARLALRTKHLCRLCGESVCGSCSRSEEVEERIGVVDKVRVCVRCRAETLRQAFERSETQRWQLHELQHRHQDEEFVVIQSRVDSQEDEEGPRRRPYLIV